MPANTIYYPYLGSGKIYARTAGAAAGLIEIGNATKLELSVKEDKKKQQDFRKVGGGVYSTVSRVSEVSLQMTVTDLNKTNVARAIFGTEVLLPAGSATAETVTGYKNALAPLTHPNPASVVVKNSAGTVTYVANTDYEVRPGGIFILTAGAITDGSVLKVDYTYGAYDRVEAMTSSAVTLELYFEGLNEANSGKPVIVSIYRALLSPTKALSLLGDKFADMDVEAEVLADTSKSGAGVSQYFQVKLA